MPQTGTVAVPCGLMLRRLARPTQPALRGRASPRVPARASAAPATLGPMSDHEGGTVRHTHGGAEWDIPIDLLEWQRKFDEADAAAATAIEQDTLEEARGRRLAAALEINRHPWLEEHRQVGRRFQADTAMKNLARSAG
jgi:hypothetical protein